jgi:hypothetical protein
MEALLWERQMAVGLIMQFSGVDAAKYDAIVKEAGLKGKNAVWPAGIISHAAGPPRTAGVSLTCGVRRHNSTDF